VASEVNEDEAVSEAAVEDEVAVDEVVLHLTMKVANNPNRKLPLRSNLTTRDNNDKNSIIKLIKNTTPT
jgi:hypothetical protein